MYLLWMVERAGCLSLIFSRQRERTVTGKVALQFKQEDVADTCFALLRNLSGIRCCFPDCLRAPDCTCNQVLCTHDESYAVVHAPTLIGCFLLLGSQLPSLALQGSSFLVDMKTSEVYPQHHLHYLALVLASQQFLSPFKEVDRLWERLPC